jgi:hypothetical protein
MQKTTVWLTDDQRRDLENACERTQRTEADLISEGIDYVIEARRQVPRKPGPLFALNDPVLDDPARAVESLAGFGA